MKLNIPENYKPNNGEINNLVYLTLKYTIKWPMRAADLAVIKTMVGEIEGEKGITQLIEQTCEYAWDHICGETDEFTPYQLVKHITPVLQDWYQNTSQKERSNTEKE